MTTLTATGYIIQDRDGYAIFGIGETKDEAWVEVVDGVGAFHGPDGGDIPADEARDTQFVTYPATAALLAQVRDCGGQIAWGMIDGVACTADEEDAAA